MCRVSLIFSYLVFLSSGLLASDSGMSHQLKLKHALSADWYVVSSSKLASRADLSDYFAGYTGLALGRHLNSNWNANVGYRHIWAEKDDQWLQEQRPHLGLTYKKVFADFRIANRSRFEFRFYDFDKDDDVRFRNKTVLEAPWELTKIALKPYLEEEVFFGFNQESVVSNRFGGGVSWRPDFGVKFTLGYRWQYQRTGEDWVNFNEIVTGVSLLF